MGGGVWEGTVPLAQLPAGFESLPLLPTSKLGPSGADSLGGWFVYVLGPCGSLQWTLLWGWEFLLLLQPPQTFSVRGFEALFPHTGNLGCTVCLVPQLFFSVYPHANVEPPALPVSTLPGPPAAALLVPFSSHRLAVSLLHPGCPSPPLILAWMNVSSLTPWLLDFHTVWFSGSSG